MRERSWFVGSDAVTAPLRFRRRYRVNVKLEDGLDDATFAAALAVMALTPDTTYMLATENHQWLRDFFTRIPRDDNGDPDTGGSWLPGSGALWAVREALENMAGIPDAAYTDEQWRIIEYPTSVDLPLPNLWLGVTVTNQKDTDPAVDNLLATPAALRWLNCRPLLGPILLREEWLVPPYGIALGDTSRTPESQAGFCAMMRDAARRIAKNRNQPPPAFIDWVVAAGDASKWTQENGAAKPTHPDWLRKLRDRCAEAGIPFRFDRWGTWVPAKVGYWYSQTMWVHPEDVGPPAYMCTTQNKTFRELDGRTWDGMPTGYNPTPDTTTEKKP